MSIIVESITTQFGKAKIEDGYWRITTSTEGNMNKYLHRLFFEKYHKCTLLKKAIIHHKDGNKLNNRIDNLELLTQSEHSTLHNPEGRTFSEEIKKKLSENHADFSGENNPFFGKTHSDKTKEKISESRKGMLHSDETKIKMSKSQNSSGYKNVYKDICETCKQGFRWKYRYYEDLRIKTISSVDIRELEKKVKEKGLPWVVLEEVN